MSELNNINFFEQKNAFVEKNVHIRIQQRNGKKSITTIEGLDEKKIYLQDLLKYFKSNLHCNGNIENDAKFGKIIRLSGDNRKSVSEILIKEGLAQKENIKIHGDL